MKTRWAVAALLMGLIVVAVPCLGQEAAAPASHNLPVLAYHRSGGFPPVPAVGELLVYSNGEAVLTKFPASFGYCEGSASAEHISKLQAQLAAAGAFFLADDLTPVPDRQAVTVTFFVPAGSKGRARSNTFAFTAGAPGPYSEVEKAVESFIAAVFPHC